MKKLFFSLVFLGLFLSCSNSQDREVMEVETTMEECIAARDGDYEEAVEPTDEVVYDADINAKEIPTNEAYARKIERTIDLTIKTDDVVKEKNMIEKFEKRCGGYAESETYDGNRYYLTLRIPTEKVDMFMDSLASGTTGKITEKSESIIDLSSTYYDNVSRKKSKDAALDRYRELFKQAKNITEILQIQTQIDRIQEEADLAASRIKEIDNRVAYSTISITINPRVEVEEDEEGFFFQIWDGIQTGWAGLVGFVIILVNLWPLVIVGGIVVYFIVKRKKKKKQAKTNAENGTSVPA